MSKIKNNKLIQLRTLAKIGRGIFARSEKRDNLRKIN